MGDKTTMELIVQHLTPLLAFITEENRLDVSIATVLLSISSPRWILYLEHVAQQEGEVWKQWEKEDLGNPRNMKEAGILQQNERFGNIDKLAVELSMLLAWLQAQGPETTNLYDIKRSSMKFS